jgi:hypothetical protein
MSLYQVEQFILAPGDADQSMAARTSLDRECAEAPAVTISKKIILLNALARTPWKRADDE